MTKIQTEECISCEDLVAKLQDENLIRKSNMRVVYRDDDGKYHPVTEVTPTYSEEIIELGA